MSTQHQITFTIYQDHLREWRWRASRFSPKGQLIIADSGESYKSRFNATRAVLDFQAAMRSGAFDTVGQSTPKAKPEPQLAAHGAVPFDSGEETERISQVAPT